MYSTRGHQQIVNEYHDECIRKAKEREIERDGRTGRLPGGDSAAPRAPEGTSPHALKPVADANLAHARRAGAVQWMIVGPRDG
jgi:hypothetical protein